MKKVILALALIVAGLSFNGKVEAQNINVSINLGRQPAWGPTGYDYAGYYYFPDIDCYYDVNVGMFHYMDRGRWISARYLPYAYRNYDLYRTYKVVLNVAEPWRYHRSHYRDYARYRNYHKQVVIRDSREHRYRDSRNNRVAWYSDHKSHGNRDRYNDKNYRYNNDRNNRYSNDKNNRYSNDKNHKYNNDRKRSSDRKYNAPDRKNDNKRRDFKSESNKRTESVRPSSRSSSSRDNNKSSVRSSEKSNYKLASNRDRRGGR